MTDLASDPAIQKLIAYAKKKKTITYDEVNDFLPEEIVSSDRIEEVIAILEKNEIKLEEEDLSLEVEEEKPATGKQKLLPIVGKTCGVEGCRLPAVYKDISGNYDNYKCSNHLPEKVKELYE